MTAASVPHPTDLCRAVEDLRCTHRALMMAAVGIAADLHHSGGNDDGGVYYLLMAVADKMDGQVARMESLTGCHSR